MLTKKDVKKIAKSHGMSYSVKILPDSPLFNNTQNLIDFANACHAAGMAAGEEEVIERCEFECARMITDEAQRLDVIVAIRALKEQK